ncbi:MAG: Holliday junction resolvase RuvX [Candidatus Paceibacteria bacterium]
MNILSIDPGSVRIGVAHAQSELGIAFPLTCLTPQSLQEGVDHILHLVEAYHIEYILLGWPLSLSNEQTEQTQAVQSFYSLLSQQTKVPIERVDERFSTKRAYQNDYGNQTSVDMEAARIILEDWLSQNA